MAKEKATAPTMVGKRPSARSIAKDFRVWSLSARLSTFAAHNSRVSALKIADYESETRRIAVILRDSRSEWNVLFSTGSNWACAVQVGRRV